MHQTEYPLGGKTARENHGQFTRLRHSQKHLRQLRGRFQHLVKVLKDLADEFHWIKPELMCSGWEIPGDWYRWFPWCPEHCLFIKSLITYDLGTPCFSMLLSHGILFCHLFQCTCALFWSMTGVASSQFSPDQARWWPGTCSRGMSSLSMGAPIVSSKVLGGRGLSWFERDLKKM